MLRRLLPLAAACAAMDPQYAVNLTLYHVHPRNYTGITNMNTGDAAGDAYFDLKLIADAIACRNTSDPHYGVDCDSPEQKPDVTLTRVLVVADGRFNDTGYGQCNICTNGSVWHHPDEHCNSGEYVCLCDAVGGHGRNAASCAAPIGREIPAKHYAPQPIGPFPRSANGTLPDYAFWRDNLIEALQDGAWYSTFKSSQCDGSNDATCTWRVVKEDKTIDKACHTRELESGAEKLNPGCFTACPESTDKKSHCWAECFYNAMFGPDAGRSSYAWQSAEALSAEKIIGLWTAPFDSCPAV